MNFAIPFMRNFKYLNEDVQFNIIYEPSIKELDNFIEAYGNHRINFMMREITQYDIDIIHALNEKYPKSTLVVCLPFYHRDLESKLKEEKILHYYNEIVTNWDKFNGFLSLDVTDIMIGEEIAFFAEILSKLAKENGKSLRTFCNVCQSSWDATPSLKTFFVRPEDIDLYEGIIDTFEFYVDYKDYHRLNVLYEIYAKDKKWFGKLKEIIIGYEGEDDSRFIIPRFGMRRLNCGKKCGYSSTCHLCDRIAELGQTLQDNKFMIVDKK